MPTRDETSADGEIFQALFDIAAALPWSEAGRLYKGLARILLEHIMMTCVSASVSEGEPNEETELKRRTFRFLEDATSRGGISLRASRELAELYVEALVAGGNTVPVQSEGDRCSWILGCPSLRKMSVTDPPSLRAFCTLEDDHVFPKARKTLGMSGVPGQKLCAYHNREWKRAHIAFAFPDEWFTFRRLG